jgi:hypothetical protein
LRIAPSESGASLSTYRWPENPGAGQGRNGERDFHGEKPSNAMHASTTDPEAQLYRKERGEEAKLSFMGHVLMENRSGLIVATTLVRHSPGARRITVGADKGYDAASRAAITRSNARSALSRRYEHPCHCPKCNHRGKRVMAAWYFGGRSAGMNTRAIYATTTSTSAPPTRSTDIRPPGSLAKKARSW